MNILQRQQQTILIFTNELQLKPLGPKGSTAYLLNGNETFLLRRIYSNNYSVIIFASEKQANMSEHNIDHLYVIFSENKIVLS